MRLNKLLLTIITTMLIVFQSSAQSMAISPRADKLYDQFNFSSAAKIYARLVKKNPANTAAKIKLASCYRLINRSDLSEIWYGQLASTPNADPINKYYYAQALRNNGKYDEAKEYYAEYAKIADPSDKRAQEILRGISVVSMLGKDNPAYTIQCLPLNTTASDFGPCIYKDQLLFASKYKQI